MNAVLTITPYLDEGRTTLSPQRVASRLSLQMDELAARARVHRNSLRVHPEGPKIQSFLRQVIRVLAAAEATFGDKDAATAWFLNEPLAAFDHLTAFDLVNRDRTDDVVAYLGSISSGFVG